MSKRIKVQVSKTAQLTCGARALSYYSKDRYYKSEDYLAPIFMSPYFVFIVKHFPNFASKFASKGGGYEYLISRTKLIDEFVKNHSSKFQQILILGAGFDSRAIRFNNELSHATIFELDAPITQNAKINRLRGKKIKLPSNLKFIPADFTDESLPQKLDAVGFKKEMTSLYILEGLTYYLDQETINTTFNQISEYSGKDSMIVFDYIYSSVIRQETTHKAEERIYQGAAKIGENLTFGIEKGQIEQFLLKYKFELVDEFDSNRLGEKYFRNEKGEIFAPVIGIHSIVIARKM
ncbi:MAG: methyltransferase [Firmicutes bacterium]|nr:methyltransferase [Bacillota bacterium]